MQYLINARTHDFLTVQHITMLMSEGFINGYEAYVPCLARLAIFTYHVLPAVPVSCLPLPREVPFVFHDLLLENI